MTPQDDHAEPSVGELFHRLVADGRDYARAEIDVVRETARSKVMGAKTAVILGVAAIFVVQAGLTVLFIALGSVLALLIGVWAGQLVAALIAFAVAGLMVKFAISSFSAGQTPSREASKSS